MIKKEYFWIGLFTLGALAIAAFGFIVVGTEDFLRPKDRFILYFKESVNGLEVGAPVKFKGVRVGEVQAIQLHLEPQQSIPTVPVIIQVDQALFSGPGKHPARQLREHIRLGLQAQLQLVSALTGLLYVELDYNPKAPLLESPTAPGATARPLYPYPEIPTRGAVLSHITQDLATTIGSLRQVNFQQLGQELSQTLQLFRQKIEAVDMARLSSESLSLVQGLAEGLQPKRLAGALEQLQAALAQAQTLMKEWHSGTPPVLQGLSESIELFKHVFTGLEAIAEDAHGLVGPRSAERRQLLQTLEEISTAARALGILADYLERNPNALVFGKPRG